MQLTGVGRDLTPARRRWAVAVVAGVGAYLVHTAGALSGWYIQYGWYQNLTHAGSAGALAALVAAVGLSRGYDRQRLLAFVVGWTLVGAVGWEVLEYLGFLDAYGVYLHFHGFHDAAIDMASNAVGVGVVLSVLVARSRPSGDRD